MKAITFTKKQIKRIAVAAGLVVATAAVGITAAVTSVGTRAEERRLPIYNVDRGDKKIALTFDVAWENSNTRELIDILGEANAKATFFITGDWCDRYPDDVKEFFDAGHEIENHSDKHPHVEGINVNDLINDTKECSRKIKMLTGEEPALYRAPYGEFDDNLITTLDGMGMKVIQWDVDSVDWKKPSAEQIKKRVLKNVKSGSIVLFHNDLENTTDALPDILKTLKSQGYEFVRVSELIYDDNFTIDANGKQIPTSESSIDLSEESIKEVLAQYSGALEAAGVTEEQIAAAVAAIKRGDLTALPAELQPLAAEVMARVSAEANSTPPTASSTSSTAATSAEEK